MDDDTYVVGYAYFSSPLAKRLGRAAQGCYYVTTAKTAVPFDTFAQALAHAPTTGLKPDRWSLDHPLNERFRPDHPSNLPRPMLPPA